MGSARIEIKRVTDTVIDGRRSEAKETAFYTCWCETGDLRGRELYDALSIKLENTATFKVRYCQRIKTLRRHLKEFVIYYDGDRYELYAADFEKGNQEFVLLKANCVS